MASTKQYAKPLAELIKELSKLPGIGGKSAQRLAFHILALEDREAMALASMYLLMDMSAAQYLVTLHLRKVMLPR